MSPTVPPEPTVPARGPETPSYGFVPPPPTGADRRARMAVIGLGVLGLLVLAGASVLVLGVARNFGRLVGDVPAPWDDTVLTAPSQEGAATAPGASGPAATSPAPETYDATYSGTGPADVTFETPVAGDAVIALHQEGQGFGYGSVVAAEGQGTTHLRGYNTFDAVALSSEPTSPLVGARIDVQGDWTLSFAAPESLPVWDGSSPVEGQGFDVVRPARDVDLASVALAYEGDDNVAVWSHGPDGTRLLVNEIGTTTVSLDVTDPEGAPEYLTIETTGTWRLVP